MTETLSGNFSFADNSTYVGEYIRVDNVIKRHGTGIFKSPTFTLEATFDNDTPINGKLSFNSNCVYEGDFKNGVYEGNGSMIWPSGASYSGQWLSGKPHGEGKFVSAVGEEFVGVFENGTGPGLSAIP
ncbi:hypothetical protein RCL1_006798 [Eukaryota sp. TZLM3-RCL]